MPTSDYPVTQNHSIRFPALHARVDATPTWWLPAEPHFFDKEGALEVRATLLDVATGEEFGFVLGTLAGEYFGVAFATWLAKEFVSEAEARSWVEEGAFPERNEDL